MQVSVIWRWLKHCSEVGLSLLAFVFTGPRNRRRRPWSLRLFNAMFGRMCWFLWRNSLLPLPKSFPRSQPRYVLESLSMVGLVLGHNSTTKLHLFWLSSAFSFLIVWCFFFRFRRPRVSLWPVLQICRSWPRSSQCLHRISPHRRRQNPDQSHWQTVSHVCNVLNLHFLFHLTKINFLALVTTSTLKCIYNASQIVFHLFTLS